ncbi:probable replication factor C subunit 1 [Tetranychus urticae]|uniref:AAA+ ATPase domain-containing protein n=1 Tax=Tetranychus urticae TaxID=32264 RepID=T1KWC1_TETUR|nr:probable replication factor C subunit 1 [Tetranychus urticae]
MDRFIIRKAPVVIIDDCPVGKRKVSQSRRKRCADQKVSTKKIKRQPSVEELPSLKIDPEVLWTNKYKPTCTKDMVGSHDKFNEIKRWIQDWSCSEDCWSNETLLIIGPPGIGKTSLVYAIAQELQYKIFEVNCSLAKKILQTTEKLHETIQTHQVCRNDTPKLTKFWSSPQTELNDRDDLPEISLSSNSIILFDDIDFMISDGVNGFWRALKNLILESKKPIILTATRYSEYLELFINPMKIFKIEPPQSTDIVKHINSIIVKEQSEILPISTSRIESFNGDVRRALNEYQYNSHNFKDSADDKMEITLHDDAKFTTLHYDLLCLSDVVALKAGIQSPDETRSGFMKGQDIPFNEMTNWRETAVDFIETINVLTKESFGDDSRTKTRLKDSDVKKFNDKLNDSYKKYNRSMSNQAFAIEFFPYLSIINTHLSSRRYQTRGSKQAKVPIGSVDPFLVKFPELD